MPATPSAAALTTAGAERLQRAALAAERKRQVALAVAWIALNDEPLDRNIDTVAGYISTLLAADLLDMPPRALARRVVTFRRQHNV